jgi:CBS domain-containing protein
MNIGEICRRRVATVQRGEDLSAAARLMREHHVGFLVVVESASRAGASRVVGVITDRDLVVSVVARDLNARDFRVEDVMTREPVTARERDTMEYALAEMHRLGVRRLPVVDDCGALAGIVSLDDIVAQLARQLNDVSGSIRVEGQVEREIRA